MKIQYASDLHLEFTDNWKFLKQNPIKPVGEILILGGDIVPFPFMDKYLDFFNYVSDHFKEVFWIPGNHEYYRFEIDKDSRLLNKSFRENVHLVNNISFLKDGIQFIFSTLWSVISKSNQYYIQKSLNDFHQIALNNRPISVDFYNKICEESQEFICRELENNSSEKKVVVTHHVPTLYKYPAQYKKDILNEAFAVELYDLIEKYQPDCWIFGHHHSNVEDFYIGKTRMTTNQLGYVKYNEHVKFNCDKFLEL